MVKLADIHAARGRIRDGIVQTPSKRSQAFQDQVPGHLFWKFENLQRTGSFKDRGALNKLLQLSRGGAEEGSRDGQRREPRPGRGLPRVPSGDRCHGGHARVHSPHQGGEHQRPTGPR